MNTFMVDVLKTFSNDNHADLYWKVEKDTVSFFVFCSDLFHWGTADAEPITEENLPRMHQALADCLPYDCGDVYAPLLFCARERKMRPQLPYYEHLPVDMHHLFDACGPERS